jgi:hypothetical protein
MAVPLGRRGAPAMRRIIHGATTVARPLTVLIQHTLPNRNLIFSLYAHMQNNSIPASILLRGTPVNEGNIIGLVGDTGEATNQPHLHFTINRYSSINNIVGYFYSNTSQLTNYFDPLLFIDDRINGYTASLSSVWLTFSLSFSSTSSTSYVQYQNKKYSLQKAVDGGLIYREIYYLSNNQWQTFTDMRKSSLEQEPHIGYTHLLALSA